jgi:hypothetical protein
MPFIAQERRDLVAVIEKCKLQPGDLCYIYYKGMVDQWNANPRWTTAHKIKKELMFGNLTEDFSESEDEIIAEQLAWEVFFELHVMPYELKKRAENGDI